MGPAVKGQRHVGQASSLPVWAASLLPRGAIWFCAIHHFHPPGLARDRWLCRGRTDAERTQQRAENKMVISDSFGVRCQFKLDSSAAEGDERNSGRYHRLLLHQTPHVKHDSLGAADVALELIGDRSAGIAFQYLLSQ